MGRSILNPNKDQLECLRTASHLSNSAIVDTVDTNLGSTSLIGAGDIVFTKKTFVVFWFWFMFGGKLYQKNLDTTLFDTVVELNPQLFDDGPEPSRGSKLLHLQEQGLSTPLTDISDIVFRRLKRTFKDMDIKQKINILKRVIEEMPN